MKNVPWNVKLLALFNFTVDFRLYAPIAIIYFAQVSGSYALGLTIFSIEMITSSLFEIPTGIYSDMIGRKKTMVWGAVASLISLVFYALGFNFWILAIGSVFSGLARAFWSGNDGALLYESLKEVEQEDKYAYYSGKVDSMFQVALAISGLLGTMIAAISFPLAMWISVLFKVVGVGISLLIKEPKVLVNKIETNIYLHLKEAVNNFRKNTDLRLLSLASILDRGIGETIYEFQAAFIVTLWPLWAIGVVKTLGNILNALGQWFGHKLIDRLGSVKTIILGSVFSRVVNILAVIFPTLFSPFLFASAGVTTGARWIAQGALFQKHFSNEQRATMGSLNSLIGNLFFGIFAYLFGYFADKTTPARAIIIGEFLMFSVIFIYWRMFKSGVKAEQKDY